MTKQRITQRIFAVIVVVLCCGAAASADIMRADVVLDPMGSDHGPFGEMVMVYDPGDIFTPTGVYFEVMGVNNYGIYSLDNDPTIGFFDPQALQWDLTLDAIIGEISSGFPITPPPDMSFATPDAIRVVNDGDSAFVEFTNSGFRRSATWSNVQTVVPEPSAAFLLLVGLMLCVGGRTR